MIRFILGLVFSFLWSIDIVFSQTEIKTIDVHQFTSKINENKILNSASNSSGGKVFNLINSVDGIEIWGRNSVVYISKQNDVAHAISMRNLNYDVKFPFPESIDTSIFLTLLGLNKDQLKIKPVYFPKNNQLIPSVSIHYALNTLQHEEKVIDFEGNILHHQNLLKLSNDTLVKGWVHYPNPLSSSYTNYGDSATDNNDSNSVFLENQLFEKDVLLTLDSSGKALSKNKYLKISDFSKPNFGVPQFSLPLKKYNRSESEFEVLNTIYYITQMSVYLEQLGFNNLTNQILDVDPHGFDGADQSAFNSFFSPPRLIFGTGGVDDAEDAEVILHEMGHAIYFAANPNARQGQERAAIEEAICDYLAVSLTREMNPFNWHRVFKWDGHNEFWGGRIINSVKKYPTDIQNNLYSDAEIFSSALMEIWETIGKAKADQILLESLFLHVNQLNMTDAARLILLADESLFNGENQEAICEIFIERGILENCTSQISESRNSENEITIFIQKNILQINNHTSQKVIGQIYNSLGQLVKTYILPSGNSTINLSDLTSGLYLLNTEFGTEKIYISE